LFQRRESPGHRAGETAPEDFIAEDENGRTIGRIYRHHTGRWFYAFQAHGPDIRLAERAYMRHRRRKAARGRCCARDVRALPAELKSPPKRS